MGDALRSERRIVEQTLANWVKAEKTDQLRGVNSEQMSAERMENCRLRVELAWVTMERDILVSRAE